MPASWMPTSTPLREISDTTLDPRSRPAASDAHLDAAIVRFRKKWWLPAMKRAAASPPTTAIAGDQVAQQQVARRLASACAARRPCSVPARRGRRRRSGRGGRASAASRGPRSSRKKRRRSTDSSSPTPNHSVRPPPSFKRRERAPRTVLDDPHRHRRRADARHRPDVRRARCPSASVISPRSSSAAASSRVAPALEHRRGEQRAALRIAHAIPRDRRAGVQQHPVAQPRARPRPPARRSRPAA